MTIYSDDLIPLAKAMAAVGATQREIAEYFEVDERTLRRWAIQHPAFAAELKTGNEVADDRVQMSLYRRAVGYSFDAEKLFHYEGGVTRVPVVEHVPPDTTACIFWLKNRRRQQWRDKQEVEHSGTIDGAPGDLALRLGTTLASMAPTASSRKRSVQ